jgi:transposase
VSKYEVLVKAVTVQHLSYGEVAGLHNVSKTLVHKLHHRWLAEGDAAFEERSRRPKNSPSRTPASVRERVLALRTELLVDGLDAGADTNTQLLSREGVQLSRTTIWRILTAAGKITPQPQKRPRSSWLRFAATVRTSSGSQTSPIGASATVPTPKSSAGSMITPATSSI